MSDRQATESAPRRRPQGGPPKPARTVKPLTERQKRQRRRALPLGIIALIAFIAGVVSAAGSPEHDSAKTFIDAWARQDFAAMEAELTPSAQEAYPQDKLAAAYRAAQTTSTAISINPGEVGSPDGDVVKVKVTIGTTIWGDVGGELALPFENGKIAWQPNLVFPSLQDGEALGRRLTLPDRADILARDGTPLAEGQGSARSSPLGTDAIDIAGELGTPTGELKDTVESEGYPGDQDTGVSGLELAFNARLAGKPGGDLLAVSDADAALGPDVSSGTDGRVLASSETAPGLPVKTTVDPEIQQTTVAALGGQSGGAAVLDARSGQVRALAGSAFSSPQPPGSTFKIITTTAGLEEGKVKLDEYFTPVSEINAGGRVISNSQQEICGGTFIEAFAESCNTVFAPLGVEVGEDALVSTAERYGFNQIPSLYDEEGIKAVGVPTPSIPEDPGDDVDLAATAIGQGQVLATPLVMASASQTVAAGGVRSPTALVTAPKLQSDAKRVNVTSKENALILKRLMLDVVAYGTGTSANLGSIQVAGKTGTAELGPKPGAPAPAPGEQQQAQILDAWFTAFAPADDPKLAVAVLLIDASGDGGEVAAPIAASILASSL
ncbi:MAG: penicillin-binding transpeptidase domain-containing protein [Solirubrobacterales bacterium]|nr:penicillin-binding transpeptidase domain-containing protein [Solirubrobacterales bacterium]